MKRWLTVLIPAIALAGLIGWRLNVKKTEAANQTKMREMRMKSPPVVTVAPAAVQDIVHTFEAVGSVEAPLNVKLASKVTGRIDYLQVHEGDRVTRGQVLARIDPSEIQAQVSQQQAAVAEAESRLAQAQITQNPTNVGVNTQITQQRAALASAKADYNQVKQNYNSQVAAANAAVTDAQGRVNNALASIANAKAAIASAQANLDNARSKYNRVSDLYKQGFIAAQDVDDARTTVSVQQGALDVAQGQLNAANAMRDSAAAQLSAARDQARIVATKGKADIAAADAKVKQARAALEYARSTTAMKPAYVQNIAALKASVEAARASLNNAKAQLSNTVLTSPLDGYVTGRYMDPGATATPGQPILAVQELRQVWVNVPIPEEESSKVAPGQLASVTLDAIPGRTFTGKIVQLNPSADSASRQFTARVLLENPQNLIRPGMWARVKMTTGRIANAIVVPREAIQRGEGGAAVMVVDENNVAHRQPVEVGTSDVAVTAVLQGLRPGDKVITLSATPVKDGQTVRIAGTGGKPEDGRRK